MKQPVVVAIAFSAGGLSPLKTFFDYTPLDDTAYIILCHLLPGFKSELQTIIQKHSQLQVVQATDGDTLIANRVYVLSEYASLTISNGTLRVLPLKEDDGANPIDTFLTSLSSDRIKRKAVVIFSGAGSDGTKGIRFLKASGGLVIAQSPSSCEFDGMPKNAIASGFVDHIALPQNIPAYLTQWEKAGNGTNHTNDDALQLLAAMGAGIRKIRIEKNVTQSGLSALCGIQKASISRIESGKANITAVSLLRIAAALNVEVSAFFEKNEVSAHSAIVQTHR